MNAASVIETAERESLMDWLGNSVLRTACGEFAAMRAQGLNIERLAINVSPLELRQTDYAEQVVRAVKDAGLSFHDIELEITESASLSDPTLILDHLHTLADLGISIAVDDFGAGHSRLDPCGKSACEYSEDRSGAGLPGHHVAQGGRPLCATCVRNVP